jgi:hypothetical protein
MVAQARGSYSDLRRVITGILELGRCALGALAEAGAELTEGERAGRFPERVTENGASASLLGERVSPIGADPVRPRDCLGGDRTELQEVGRFSFEKQGWDLNAPYLEGVVASRPQRLTS